MITVQPVMFLAMMGISIVAALVQGAVLAQLWAWFIVRTFGLKPLTIPQAIGLIVVAGIFQLSTEVKNFGNSDREKLAQAFVNSIIAPLIVLAIGAIAQFWV